MTFATSTPAPPTPDRLLACIDDFESTLSPAQRDSLRLEHSAAYATRWSNLPEVVLGGHGRLGLSTATLNADSWPALWALLGATTGSATDLGLDALRQHLDADDLLAARDDRMGYGRDAFTIALLGRPDRSGSFAIQFGGHHLALLNTYRDGELVAATPAFRGIEPFGSVGRDGRVVRPMHVKHDALVALLADLDDGQRAAARLLGPPSDLVLGPGEDRRFPVNREGVRGTELSDDQRGRLRDAIASFTGDVEDTAAQRLLARYERELDDTRVALGGRVSLESAGDYVRIDGPSVWIELSMRPGINFPAPHPHAVWRDRSDDYGRLSAG